MTGWVRLAARHAGIPVRLIKADAVPRCGPLGGIYTGLSSGSSEAGLFLACDMPFVSAELLTDLIKVFDESGMPVCVEHGGRQGLPCVIPRSALPVVEGQIRRKEFSLRQLFRELGAQLMYVSEHRSVEMLNVNTREDLQHARLLAREKSGL